MSWVLAFCIFSRILGTSEHILIYEDQVQDGDLFSIPPILTVAFSSFPNPTVTVTTVSGVHSVPASSPLRLTVRFFPDHLHLFVSNSSPPLLVPASPDASASLVFHHSPSAHVTPSSFIRNSSGPVGPALTWGLCGAGALLIAVGLSLAAKIRKRRQAVATPCMDGRPAAVEAVTLEEGRALAVVTAAAVPNIAVAPETGPARLEPLPEVALPTTDPLAVAIHAPSGAVSEQPGDAVQAPVAAVAAQAVWGPQVAKAAAPAPVVADGAAPAKKAAAPVCASAKAKAAKRTKRASSESAESRQLGQEEFGAVQLTQEEKQILTSWYQILVYRDRVQQQYRGG